MRIATSQLFQSSITAMLDKQADLAKTQLQLATGERILAPSDDPAAASTVLQLDQLIATTDQYQRNADLADERLKREETALGQVVDIIQRVRELAVQANNDVMSNEDRDAIAVEVRQNLDALLQIANTRDSNGDYLFAGNRVTTEPFSDGGSGTYAYNGDQGQRAMQVGENRQVTVGNPGDEIFMAIDDGAGGQINMFEAFYTFVTDLESNAPQGVTLTQMDSALQKVSDIRASVGARMNTIEQQRSANDAIALVLEENRSALRDVDYAEAVSRFEQQVLALQAAQQTFVRVQGLSLFNFL